MLDIKVKNVNTKNVHFIMPRSVFICMTHILFRDMCMDFRNDIRSVGFFESESSEVFIW